MTRIGADPGQLLEAAAGFDVLAESLDAAQREITSLLDADWWGPDADRFRGVWASVFRAEIVRQADAIRTYANATRRQAEQQQGTSDDRAVATGGSAAGKRAYRLQDVEGSVALKGGYSDKGSVAWSNEQPGSPTPAATPEPQPPGPGQPGFDPDVYEAWFVKQAGLVFVDKAIQGSGATSVSQRADWTWSASGSIGDANLGLSGSIGAEAGASLDASASYNANGPRVHATADMNLHAGARVFGAFEGHAWKIAGVSGQAAGSVDVGVTGHVGPYADWLRGVGVDAQGSAFAGAHAEADLSVNAIGVGAHVGAEANAGIGVYGSAKAAWTDQKGLTLGLSGGFGLMVGFGLNAEFSFHPGHTWDAAVAGVTNSGAAIVNTAVNVVDTAGKVANVVGAAVNGTIAAMDPRNWKWPW